MAGSWIRGRGASESVDALASHRSFAVTSGASRVGEPAENMQPVNYDAALQHYQAGRFAEASAICGVILNQTPRDFPTLRLLGSVRGQQGAFDEAVYFLTAALGIGSPDTEAVMAALNELAAVELAQQHHDAALDSYRRALAIRPDDAGTMYNYGNAFYAANRIDDALEIYGRGLALHPDYAEMHNNFGNALRSAKRLEAAADSYRRALALAPDLVAAHNNLGKTLCLLERAEEAVACHRQALAIKPDDADSLIDLAYALHILKRSEEAADIYRRALLVRPDDQAARLGLGLALTACYRYDEAIVPLMDALAIDPGDGNARTTLGTALLGMNRPAEALQQFRAARAALPDSQELLYNEAIVLLTMGEWQEGWERFEVRFSIPRLSPLPQLADRFPRWRGEGEIAGKTILLQAEQGLGDTLQFVRYTPLVADLGATVVLRIQPQLHRLMADMPGAATIITSYDEVPDVDLMCPLMGLPRAFGTRVDSIPAHVPYLRAPWDYELVWHALLGQRTRPRIGIAWSGKQHLPYRSMPLAALEPLLRRPDLEFHSLQQEVLEPDRDWQNANPLVIDHSAQLKNFADTAALIAQMDLVVTIDTAVAHLAGAMAHPTWIMLPFCADFRWLIGRADTPWYPTARLFRQKRNGVWTDVVAEVARALAVQFPAPR
jgi:tetratricopeptide (TPR) repeat protein